MRKNTRGQRTTDDLQQPLLSKAFYMKPWLLNTIVASTKGKDYINSDGILLALGFNSQPERYRVRFPMSTAYL